jgi:hypothetical protein
VHLYTVRPSGSAGEVKQAVKARGRKVGEFKCIRESADVSGATLAQKPRCFDLVHDPLQDPLLT